MNGKEKESYKTLLALPPLGRYASRKEWEHACWQKMLNSENLKDLLGIAVTSYERHTLISYELPP